MNFPPAWEFIEPEAFEGFAFRRQEERPLGLEIVLQIEEGEASNFRLVPGGNSMLSISLKAEKLLGSKFAGTLHPRPDKTLNP